MAVVRISGIVVSVERDYFDDVVGALEQLPGIDVHERDVASCRIVVTQDVETDADHERGLGRIQQLPHVRYAQLVYHYFEDESEEEHP